MIFELVLEVSIVDILGYNSGLHFNWLEVCDS